MDTMTETAAAAAPVKDEKDEKPSTGKYGRWKARIEESRTIRKRLADEVWKTNVQYRRGKPFADESEIDRVAVPADWSLTKAKEAGLFSQVPTVILKPAHPKYRDVTSISQRELNDLLQKHVKIEVAMEESLADVINASGMAVVKVGYLATFKDVEIPDQDISGFPPETQQALIANKIVKMLPTKQRVDCRFYAERLSPSQALWPADFKGSDFDNADWVGWDGSFTWAQALREFGATTERPNGLTEEMKEKVCGTAIDERDLTLNEKERTDRTDENRKVSFTEIFYYAARQDPKELYLDKIRRMVFVTGIDDPVIDEDLEWQQWSPETESFVGLTKYPLRFCTLTYISDQCVPPSDSEIGRPQVDEQIRSRSQMVLQRDRSQPLRWANVNRIDPMILQNIMRGDTQQIIPVNGDGASAIGETARANYPKEDWDFDRVIKGDLMDAWQVGPNQTGSFNTAGRTAAEANIVQTNFATRQAKERGKIAKFFLGIAECVLGLMQLYYDGPKEAALIGPEAQQQLDQQWNRKAVSGAKFVFELPKEDAAVKLDTGQRIQQLERFLNIASKSGFLNVMPVMEELASLHGLDPSVVVVKPNPKAPEPPNVSLRAGGEDLRDPVVGAYLIALMQKGHPVAPEDITAAHQLLMKASDLEAAKQQAQTAGAPPPSPGAPHTPQPPDDYGPIERVTKRVSEVGG